MRLATRMAPKAHLKGGILGKITFLDLPVGIQERALMADLKLREQEVR